VAVGDAEKAWNIGNGFGRMKGEEMEFFLSYLDFKAQNTQVSNALGNGNAPHTLDIFSKIPTGRSWTSVS